MNRFLSKILLLMLILLTSHCRFTRIEQPVSVLPGSSVTVELTVAVDIVPENNLHLGVLCLLIPDDWSVSSAVYSSPHGDGTMAFSAAWTDSAEACYPLSELPAGMTWVGMISDTGYTYQDPFNIDITVELQAGQNQGCFNLGYLVTKATPNLICSGSPSWAPFSYPNPIAVSTSSEICDTALVERAVEWDDLLNRRSGWTGSDGIYTIPLSGLETPGNTGEQTLILFSDTFIGDVDSSGRRQPGWRLINNTTAYLDGLQPLESNIDFFWAEDGNNQPEAIFIPGTPNSEPDNWYWLMDGIALGDSIYAFGLLMAPGNGGPFNFQVAGVTLISFQLEADHSIANYRQVDTPVYYRNDSEGWEIVFGQAIMPMHAASGNPGADGYIYIYGPRSYGVAKQLVAARVLPEHFSDFSQWRFWDGQQWGTQIENCAPLAEGISQEFSVSPFGEQFYLVYQINNSVAYRVGDSPVGPFGFMNVIYDAPEPLTDSDIFVYNAKAHPHLANPGEILISYNVNTFDFIDHINHADIYRPRFITFRPAENPVTIRESENFLPRKVSLAQNYPNPFNPSTNIPFRLDERTPVKLTIFDILGRQVRQLLNDNLPAGAYTAQWDGKNDHGESVNSGLYLYRLQTGDVHYENKMMLVK